MRCKKHYSDVSSSIGVCAFCLRERLLSLIAAQEEATDGGHSAAPTRKSDHHHHRTLSDQQFYAHPAGNHNSNKKKSFIRFFSFQNMFRSSTTSWFSTILHGGRHRRRKPTVCVEESDPSGVVRRRDRGMSPSDLGNGDEDDLNGCEKNTPKRTPVRRGGGGGHVRNLSFCLSPLVRASPNRQRNQPEMVLAGEIRGPAKPPHLSNTKSFCANRSRKLADFGRTNPNR